MKFSRLSATRHPNRVRASSVQKHFRLISISLLLLAVDLILSGCLSRPAIAHKTFALTAPPARPVAGSGQGVLALRNVRVSPLFEGRSFIYRVGTHQYEADPYAEFVVPPNRALSVSVRAYLRNSGIFRDVVEPDSQLEPDSFLEIHADELYGDFRKSEIPAAILSIRLLLFDRTGDHQKLVWQKEYAQRIPLKESTAAALAAGWNEALAEIMAAATPDIATARAKITAQ